MAIETWVKPPDHLKAVLDKAERGSKVLYAIGDLGYERVTASGKAWSDADGTARLAYYLYETGEADLTQCRLGPHKSEYWIKKLVSGKVREMPPSEVTLMSNERDQFTRCSHNGKTTG